MSRSFNGSSAFIEASAVLSAAPCSVSLWIRPTSLSAQFVPFYNGQKASSLNSFRFLINTSGDLNWQMIGSSITAATIAGVISTNVWQHIMGVSYAQNSHACWHNGGSKTTSSASAGTITGLDTLSIGSRWLSGSNGLFTPGDIAEVAIWNVAIEDSEVTSLARGFSARKVRARDLQFYAPLIRDVHDVRAGRALTTTGTTVAAHPRIYS